MGHSFDATVLRLPPADKSVATRRAGSIAAILRTVAAAIHDGVVANRRYQALRALGVPERQAACDAMRVARD